MLETLPIVLIMITLIVSLFVVSGVFVNKFKGESSEKTYPKWRVRLLYFGILCGYAGGILSEIMLYQEEGSLATLIIVLLFYCASIVLVSYLVWKDSVQEDENGQKVDYRNVQFILVLILGFMPIILLS